MPTCPICGTSKFRDYNGRPAACCDSCGSLERTRFLWLHLEQAGLLKEGTRVLHVAPEKCMTKRLQDAIGSGYQPVDFAPELYATDEVKVGRFDMCADLFALPPFSYDIIMHLHVLEHIRCGVEAVLVATMRALKPGGRLIFGVPIGPGITVENIWPDLTEAQRIEHFGQSDHVRRFGTHDFPRFLARVVEPFAGKVELRVNPATLGDEVLTGAAVPPAAGLRRYSGNTLFDIVRAA